MYIGFFVVSNFYGGGAPKESWEVSEDDGASLFLWVEGGLCKRDLTIRFVYRGGWGWRD